MKSTIKHFLALLVGLLIAGSLVFARLYLTEKDSTAFWGVLLAIGDWVAAVFEIGLDLILRVFRAVMAYPEYLLGALIMAGARLMADTYAASIPYVEATVSHFEQNRGDKQVDNVLCHYDGSRDLLEQAFSSSIPKKVRENLESRLHIGTALMAIPLLIMFISSFILAMRYNVFAGLPCLLGSVVVMASFMLPGCHLSSNVLVRYWMPRAERQWFQQRKKLLASITNSEPMLSEMAFAEYKIRTR